MSLDALQDQTPITDSSELVALLQAAERPTGPLLLGLEHERLLFPATTVEPVAYEGPRGVSATLEGFSSKGFSPIRETADGPVIAMRRGAETLSLEPGGQFELSGAPFVTARAAAEELERHSAELREVCAALGVRAVGLGYRPYGTLEQMPWMPKRRYTVMRSSLGARGSMAHHMMLMTATAQVSLDWRDEADCVSKVIAAARVSPVLVAMFASSPIVAGAPSGFLSFRSRVWNDVDSARCGYPQAMLDGSFSYRAYVEWALDVPLLFLRRDGRYLAPNLTFRSLLQSGFEGTPATHGDWVDHLSTLFPEVRLKRIVEIRAADSNGPAMTSALGALMRGLLYDAEARAALVRALPASRPDDHRQAHRDAQRLGLAATWAGKTLQALSVEVVSIARAGLARLGDGDAELLAPLERIASSGRPPALDVLEHHAAEGAGYVRHFEI